MGTGMAAAAIGLLLAGCNSTNGTHMSSEAASSAPATAHNAADVTFAQEMIPHHQQALDMAKLAASRSATTSVKDLAGRIEQAQDPEIQQMTRWLSQWGAMPSMSGMHGAADMRSLQQAGGTEFDKMFLQMMVSHHQGALDMAKTELAAGSNADAKALAQRIMDGQTAEITEMQHLLTTL
jgi:uncharacterized protein (DUF305 family)